MGELWDLEKLAEKCKAEGRYTFFLTSAPDNVSGKLHHTLAPGNERRNLLTRLSRKCWKSPQRSGHLLTTYKQQAGAVLSIIP